MGESYEGPATSFELYSLVVARTDNVDLKGATMPYTSLNGHMTSFLDKTGSVGLRLAPDDRNRFIDQYQTEIAEQYGSKMKDFVVVPERLLGNIGVAGDWFDKSVAWVATLDPKSTKRK